jgi:hypothetical protein
VVVSDPWSFVDDQGSNVFPAEVLSSDGDLLLIELAGGLYVATPRGETDYNLIPITEEQSREAPPRGRDQWRGQPAALLASIRNL